MKTMQVDNDKFEAAAVIQAALRAAGIPAADSLAEAIASAEDNGQAAYRLFLNEIDCRLDMAVLSRQVIIAVIDMVYDGLKEDWAVCDWAARWWDALGLDAEASRLVEAALRAAGIRVEDSLAESLVEEARRRLGQQFDYDDLVEEVGQVYIQFIEELDKLLEPGVTPRGVIIGAIDIVYDAVGEAWETEEWVSQWWEAIGWEDGALHPPGTDELSNILDRERTGRFTPRLRQHFLTADGQ